MDTTAEEMQKVINLIKEEAQAIWGKRWFSQIVHKYCAIEGRETGSQPNYLGRRHQLSRILQKGEGGTMTTLFRLAECVDLEVSLSKPLVSSRQNPVSANRADSSPSKQSAQFSFLEQDYLYT
jgi:hypothetical protein